MIGDEEVALWRQAVESADALDVYLDWLLIHDPVRGELVRRRVHDGKPSDGGLYEVEVWAKALGLDGCKGIVCNPLPCLLSIDAFQLPLLEPVLDQLPFLQINLEFDDGGVEAALASPVVAKIRRLSFTAWIYEHNNYQSATETYEFGYRVVGAVCASPNITQLEALHLGDSPGADSAKLVAAVPFVDLRELSFREAAIGDEGVLAIANSPISKTLRRLTLADSEIGDEGALALARVSQLEKLSIRTHRITAIGAAALRAMPSLKQLELVPDVVDPFESLAAFRAYCGEPTMPLEGCPLCSITPAHCDSSWVSSLVSDYDVDYGEEGQASKWDHVPAQIAELEPFLEGAREISSDGSHEDAVLRCPSCRRLYLRVKEMTYAGARTYSGTSYQRIEADPLFRARCCVALRVPGRKVEVAYELFSHHAIVRFDKARTLFSLDDNNQLIELTGDQLPLLIASDPPIGLEDATRARSYHFFVGEAQEPEARTLYSFSQISWLEPRTDDQQQQVDALRAIRIDDPVTEKVGDDICVRSWVISKRRLICRVVTVRKSGDTLREDAVIAENLPVA